MEASAGIQAWFDQLYAQALVLRTLEQEMLEATGLPLAWFEVLVQLGKAPEGRLRMGDLGRAVLLSKSGVTKVITRMGADGLVTRHVPPDNRRTTYAVITNAGRRALADALPVHSRGIIDHFARHLSATDAATISRIARTVTHAHPNRD